MQSEIVAKVKAEASLLRLTNEDLSKQVEGLQISRLNEVEELAYLRWVNSCLRDELQNSDKASAESSSLSEYSESSRSAKRLNLIRKLKKWPLTSDGLATIESTEKSWLQIEENRSPRRRHSISGSKLGIEEMLSNKRRQSDGFICAKELDKESEIVLTCPMDQTSYIDLNNNNNNSKLVSCFDVEKRALRVPNPPPRPSCLIPTVLKEESSGQVPPPPPPPPPPPKLAAVRSNAAGVVQRAPQVVEFYHSLMKRDSRKEASNGGVCDASEVANVRSNMIGEIENRSSHLLAVC